MTATLRLMVEPHVGGSYAQLLALARAAEQAGYDAVFRSDHLHYASDRPRPALEAWTTLAGLARDTSRIRLGTLVSPMTFRHPAVLAREVATVDEMSGGRVELGVGTGWFDAEHATLGIPFPGPGERTDRLHEAVEVMARLWTGQSVSYSGEFWSLDGAVALPRPVQQPLPVIVGGHGGPRSIRLAGHHAVTEYNTTSASPEKAAATWAAVRAVRPSLLTSWMGTVLVGRDDAALRRRMARVAEWVGSAPGGDTTVVGVHDEAAEQLRRYVAAGAQRIYARIWDWDDLDQISEIAEEVLPRALR